MKIGKYLNLEEMDRRTFVSDMIELLSKSDDFYDVVSSGMDKLKQNIKMDNKDPREFQDAVIS